MVFRVSDFKLNHVVLLVMLCLFIMMSFSYHHHHDEHDHHEFSQECSYCFFQSNLMEGAWLGVDLSVVIHIFLMCLICVVFRSFYYLNFKAARSPPFSYLF